MEQVDHCLQLKRTLHNSCPIVIFMEQVDHCLQLKRTFNNYCPFVLFGERVENGLQLKRRIRLQTEALNSGITGNPLR
jgi:hypothetical protein